MATAPPPPAGAGDLVGRRAAGEPAAAASFRAAVAARVAALDRAVAEVRDGAVDAADSSSHACRSAVAALDFAGWRRPVKASIVLLTPRTFMIWSNQPAGSIRTSGKVRTNRGIMS